MPFTNQLALRASGLMTSRINAIPAIIKNATTQPVRVMIRLSFLYSIGYSFRYISDTATV